MLLVVLLLLLVLVVAVVELEETGGLLGLVPVLEPVSGSVSFWLVPAGLAVLPSLSLLVPLLLLPPVPASPLLDAGEGAALLCCICGDELFDRSTERSL